VTCPVSLRSGRPRSRVPVVGSKGGAGVAQRIISLMPPHDLYVEAFADLGAVATEVWHGFRDTERGFLHVAIVRNGDARGNGGRPRGDL
jgi:hypothetical protein